MTVLCHPSTQNMAQGPAILASPGSLLEIHNLQPHPRPSQSAPAFYQDLQGIFVHIKVWETPLALSTLIWVSTGSTLSALTPFKG